MVLVKLIKRRNNKVVVVSITGFGWVVEKKLRLNYELLLIVD